MDGGFQIAPQRPIRHVVIDHEHVVERQKGVVNRDRDGYGQEKALRGARLRIAHGPHLVGAGTRWNGPGAHKVPDRFGRIIRAHGQQQAVIGMRPFLLAGANFRNDPRRAGQGKDARDLGRQRECNLLAFAPRHHDDFTAL